ncbi:MAG: tRNA epoxyqueuosine(34) reductase QueG [Bacteroidetes bacterium]|nr:tRNA epoxyqueuosine(34) reductase QueG [Bacteroidota bacterium]
MTITERTSVIRQAALDAGFDAVGVAEAVPLYDAFTHYEDWIARSYHGSLGYMERNAEKRRDVTEILPGARSVIVVALNYYTPFEHRGEGGKVARYAWGDDYHDVIPERLDRIVAAIKAIDPTAECKRYTDTGPILEKQWAVRAGLGWQGKHSNILRRDIGSWFFLGVIITTMPLEPSKPMEDHCGTCTACIDGCPTKAIVEPYVVDARSCISYWTIEAKAHEEFPSNVVEHLDGWIFGCDVCQDVCPWNRFQRPTQERRFLPRGGVTVLDTGEMLSLSPDAFASRFKGSPIKRPKLAGLQRNAKAVEQRRNE